MQRRERGKRSRRQKGTFALEICGTEEEKLHEAGTMGRISYTPFLIREQHQPPRPSRQAGSHERIAAASHSSTAAAAAVQFTMSQAPLTRLGVARWRYIHVPASDLEKLSRQSRRTTYLPTYLPRYTSSQVSSHSHSRVGRYLPGRGRGRNRHGEEETSTISPIASLTRRRKFNCDSTLIVRYLSTFTTALSFPNFPHVFAEQP